MAMEQGMPPKDKIPSMRGLDMEAMPREGSNHIVLAITAEKGKCNCGDPDCVAVQCKSGVAFCIDGKLLGKKHQSQAAFEMLKVLHVLVSHVENTIAEAIMSGGSNIAVAMDLIGKARLEAAMMIATSQGTSWQQGNFGSAVDGQEASSGTGPSHPQQTPNVGQPDDGKNEGGGHAKPHGRIFGSDN